MNLLFCYLLKGEPDEVFDAHFCIILRLSFGLINRVDSWHLERNGIRIAVFVVKFATKSYERITTILRTIRHTADWIGLRILHQNATIASVPSGRYLKEQQSMLLEGNIILFALSVW